MWGQGSFKLHDQILSSYVEFLFSYVEWRAAVSCNKEVLAHLAITPMTVAEKAVSSVADFLLPNNWHAWIIHIILQTNLSYVFPIDVEKFRKPQWSHGESPSSEEMWIWINYKEWEKFKWQFFCNSQNKKI